jgi:parvulin-like peptidyl-prolyl isomerase
MNRQILVGMVSLALAGCAQTRPAIPLARNGSRLPPVGLTPVPNIYEAINRENTRIDPAALHPEHGPVLANLDGSRPADAGIGRAPEPAAACDGPDCSQANASNPPVPLEYSGPPAVAATASPPPSAPSPAREPDLAPADLPDPSIAARPDAIPSMEPSLDQAATPAVAPEVARTSEETSGVGEDPVLSPSPPDRPGPSKGPEPSPVPEPAPASALDPTRSPPEAPLELPPAPELPPVETSSTGPELAPGPQQDPGSTGPGQGAISEPSPSPLDLPPLPPLDAEDPTPPPEGPQAAAGSRPQPTFDPAVVTAAADPTAIRAEESPVDLKEAARFAAQVGDEVITYHELTTAVKDKIAGMPKDFKPNKQEIMMISSQVLDMLIERSMIVQEAKREMKKPEMLKMFMKTAEKYWREEELPPLLRSMAVTNEYELKQKLAEQGKSLDSMIESFKLDFLARGYLDQKLRPRITVDVPEMRAYYNAHLGDFHRPAQWTWREVLVEVDKHSSRAEARGKAEAVLGRLRRGDDFAQVAQTESEGPNRTKGGLWETAPDSYAIAAVNEALGNLPIGQVSAIIEGPSSYHIVRLDARRAEGPATFPEVQDKVRNIVHRQKVQQETTAFLDKLRKQTVVTTIFDRSDYAPATTRASAVTSAR